MIHRVEVTNLTGRQILLGSIWHAISNHGRKFINRKQFPTPLIQVDSTVKELTHSKSVLKTKSCIHCVKNSKGLWIRISVCIQNDTSFSSLLSPYAFHVPPILRWDKWIICSSLARHGFSLTLNINFTCGDHKTHLICTNCNFHAVII